MTKPILGIRLQTLHERTQYGCPLSLENKMSIALNSVLNYQ